jgi:hypothetical protein
MASIRACLVFSYAADYRDVTIFQRLPIQPPPLQRQSVDAAATASLAALVDFATSNLYSIVNSELAAGKKDQDVALRGGATSLLCPARLRRPRLLFYHSCCHRSPWRHRSCHRNCRTRPPSLTSPPSRTLPPSSPSLPSPPSSPAPLTVTVCTTTGGCALVDSPQFDPAPGGGGLFCIYLHRINLLNGMCTRQCV